MEAVFALADRLTVLVYGRIIASGDPSTVRADAAVRQAYLGEKGQRSGPSWLTRRFLKLPAIETSYGLSRVLFGISLAVAARRNGFAHGPERHGQNHDGPLDHGA